jgi:hypothetical protein
MSDPVHCIKKGFSQLFKSRCKGIDGDDAHFKRSLIKYEMVDGEEIECPLSLRQGRDVWKERSKCHNEYGLSYDRKFTEEHFKPDASTRMRVRPAAQFLSRTMASWLRDDVKRNGRKHNAALALYCENWNRYFDIMNGKAGVIHGPQDPKVCGTIEPLSMCCVCQSACGAQLRELELFAHWLENWHDDLTRRGLSKAEQASAFISRECYADIRLAIHGFVAMCRFYLRSPSEFFCPQHFNQDVVEHHFRNIRGANGDSKHPTAAVAANSAQNGTVIRLNFDKKSNSGSAPILDMEQRMLRRFTSRSKKSRAE